MKSMIPALIIGKMESLAATIAETYTNEKLSIQFRSNVSWHGIDVCVDAWVSECG